LTTKTQARAPVRALVGAAAFGALIGLAMGSAYLGGAMAKSMTVTGEAKRLAPAAEAGFSNKALVAASGADESALMIARRHDPYTIAGAPERDRQATSFAARLEVRAADGSDFIPAPTRPDGLAAGLRKASFAFTPAAKPFRMADALGASRDLDCLTDAVYYEARGEGVAGMQAVAQVVLNRARHPAFPKTVCGVVFQGAGGGGCQFSFACDGSMHRAVEPMAWRRAREIASKALAGYVMTEVGNATHFHTTAVSPGWRSNMLRVAQVGSQIFYRFGGSAGGPNAFSYAPRPSTGAGPGARPQTVMAGFVPVQAANDQPAAAYTVVFKGDAAKVAAPAAVAAPKAEAPVAKVEAPKAAEAPKVEAAATKTAAPGS
jgi:hypothetical protein